MNCYLWSWKTLLCLHLLLGFRFLFPLIASPWYLSFLPYFLLVHFILYNAHNMKERDRPLFLLSSVIALPLLFFFLPFYQLNSGGKCRYCQTDRRQQTEKCTCLLKDAFLFHWSDITWTFVCHCFVPFIVFKSSLQLELANWIAFSEETQFLYLASTTPRLLSCSVEINMVDFVSWYCKLAWSVESWLYLVIASTESVGRMDMSGARPDVENGSSLGKYMGA